MPAARRAAWSRLLERLRCPDCLTPLLRSQRHFDCARGHRWPLGRFGIPVLAHPTARTAHRAAAVGEEQAATYAAMRSFAARSLQRGESEGLYRTVDDLLLRGLSRREPAWLLDVGCGSGRTAVDAATAFPEAIVVGVDSDPQALLIAHAIAHFRGQAVTADLRAWGFGLAAISGENLSNCLLVQARSEKLPFAPDADWPGFDAVTSVNQLDRSGDPRETLREMARVLAPRGQLVLATPLNWRSPGGAQWTGLGTLAELETLVVRAGLTVQEAFDGLIYREIIDIRGSAMDWRVAVLRARKDAAE